MTGSASHLCDNLWCRDDIYSAWFSLRFNCVANTLCTTLQSTHTLSELTLFPAFKVSNINTKTNITRSTASTLTIRTSIALMLFTVSLTHAEQRTASLSLNQDFGVYLQQQILIGKSWRRFVCSLATPAHQ